MVIIQEVIMMEYVEFLQQKKNKSLEKYYKSLDCRKQLSLHMFQQEKMLIAQHR
jgi:hypothetical protein